MRNLMVTILLYRGRSGFSSNFIVDCLYEVHGPFLLLFNISFGGNARNLSHRRGHWATISWGFPNKRRTRLGIWLHFPSCIWRLLLHIKTDLVEWEHCDRILNGTHHVIDRIPIILDLFKRFFHPFLRLNRPRKSLRLQILRPLLIRLNIVTLEILN